MVTAVRHTDLLRQAMQPFLTFFGGPFAQLNDQPGIANFAVGNPQEMPLPQYIEAVRSHLEPQDAHWFAYKISEPNARATVATSLSRTTGLDWDPLDVQMTNGGFAAIAVGIRTLLEPGDEAIFLSPPWFFYEALILGAGATPIRVRLESIDIAQMQQRRDRVVGELRRMGYETTNPEGTFYIMVRSPIDDDVAFSEILNRHRVLTLPGSIVELPGWLRVSLTASDEMVEIGLPGFGRALAEARGR